MWKVLKNNFDENQSMAILGNDPFAILSVTFNLAYAHALSGFNCLLICRKSFFLDNFSRIQCKFDGSSNSEIDWNPEALKLIHISYVENYSDILSLFSRLHSFPRQPCMISTANLFEIISCDLMSNEDVRKKICVVLGLINDYIKSSSCRDRIKLIVADSCNTHDEDYKSYLFLHLNVTWSVTEDFFYT